MNAIGLWTWTRPAGVATTAGLPLLAVHTDGKARSVPLCVRWAHAFTVALALVLPLLL